MTICSRLPTPLLALACSAAVLAPHPAALGAEGDPIHLGDAAARERIAAAVPRRALVPPRKPRRLLIFNLNVGYGGHPSQAHATQAFALLGERTGAFTAVASQDPEMFRPERLRDFDAVFLNNTVGNLFADPGLRDSLLDFVHAGGGLMGTHGATVAFTRWPGAHEDWPEFGLLLGARGANHRDSDERVVLKLDDPAHPLTRMFDPTGFEYRDEFFRVHEPYSRHRLRVLLSIDTARTDLNQGAARGACVRADNDYALAWVRACGRGRVFYSTIAHNPYVFWDPRMLEFYLAAAQFALGDLPAPTVPSARLTPGERARETLGWRLGIEAYTFHKYTLFEAIDKTAALGLAYLGGLSFQNVSAELPKPFDPQLSPAEVRAVRQRLDAAGLRLLTYYIHRIPGDEAGCRQVFDFARRLGIETLISEPDPAALDTIARFCDAYDIRVALHNHDRTQSPQYWRPEGVLQACQGRTPRLGACGDVGYWVRSGIDPVRAVRTLRGRLITLQVHDLHTRGPNGRDVPWGTGATRTARLVREVQRLGLTPTMWGLEYSDDWYNSLPEIAASMAFFDRTCLDLAR